MRHTERAEEGLAESDGLLVVRHVRAFLEPHEGLASWCVESRRVAGYQLRIGSGVVATLKERDGNVDACGCDSKVKPFDRVYDELLRLLEGEKSPHAFSDRVVWRDDHP